jgi:molybdopterin-binding protein
LKTRRTHVPATSFSGRRASGAVGPLYTTGPGEIVASLGMPISARNQLEGKVASVKLGDIMAHVVVKIGKSHIESVITRRSADDLKLKKGDKVTVIIKSTEVMLQKA